jgi:dihydroorotate dehydrogenase (fumarate)
MIDLSTEYLGLKLQSPIVASSSPLWRELDNIKKAEERGAGAVVLHSLFEEQILADSHRLDRMLRETSDGYAEALSYFPDMASYGGTHKAYLRHLEQARRAVGIPVIGSLNGVSTGGWTDYARQIEEAGADALELNIYFLPSGLNVSSAQIEQNYCDLVHEVRSRIRIPMAVKIGPYFTSMANMAKRLYEAGAGGLVLFNRFYQPDFDLETLEVTPSLSLSASQELRLRLHWTAMLARRVPGYLAITGGVHTGEDVVKSIMAGASVAMVTSVLLERGIGYLRDLEKMLIEWMMAHEYESVRQMCGAMCWEAVAEPNAFHRANYVKVLASYRESVV